MVKGLVLLHLLSGADGDVVTVRSFWNIIMCKITARPHGPVRIWHKDEDRGESCDPLSLESELEPRLDGLDESAHFTPLNNFILHNTCNNNTQQEVPSTLGVSVVSISRTGGWETRGFSHKLKQAKNMEQDSENLRFLVGLWDEGEGSPWHPFYRGAKRWPGSQGWWLNGQPIWQLPLYFVPKVWWLS
jgi:hypothetical protein